MDCLTLFFPMKGFIVAALAVAASLGSGAALAQSGQTLTPKPRIDAENLWYVSTPKLDLNPRKGESYSEYKNRAYAFCKYSQACFGKSKNMGQYIKCMKEIMP